MEGIDRALQLKKRAQQEFLEIYEDLYKDDNIITFEVLSEIPLNTPTIIGEGVKAEMIERHTNKLVFDCWFDPFGKLEMHKHDCEEVIKI